jgi:hypothetical protein
MKPILKIFLLFLISLFVACQKETPDYKISDDMKQYFVYQTGSFWILTNDSTNETDSMYITKTIYSKQGVADNDGRHQYSFDMITIYYQSQLFFESDIGYLCAGPNTLKVKTKLSDTNQYAYADPITYFPGWESNTKITQNNCIGGFVFIQQFLPSISINNIVYNNIIRTKIQSIDSTATYPIFYLRDIYFAKNIGIIKLIEESRYFNVYRSWSLSKYQVIQ